MWQDDDPFAAIQPRRRAGAAPPAPAPDDDPFAIVRPRPRVSAQRADAIVPFVDGFLGGTGKAITAGAGTAVRKLFQGDERPIPDIYRQLKGDVDEREQAFAEDNPGVVTGLNIVGGITGAVTSPAIRAANAIMPFGKASFGARAASNAVMGAAGGAVADASNAESLGEVPGRLMRGGGFGAVGGAGLGALFEGGARVLARSVPEPPQLGPRAPVRRTARGVEPKPVPMETFVDEPILNQLRKRPIMDEVFDAPNPNPAPVASGPMPEGYAMRELGPQLDPAGSDGLNRVAQRYGLFNGDAMATLQRRPVADRIFDQPNPNPAPAATGAFPEGYAMREIGPKLDPAGSEGMNRAVARSGLVDKDAVDVLMRRGQPDPFVTPRPDPAPASRRAFPEGFTTGAADDARFRLEGASEVEAGLLPKLAAAREAAKKAQAALDRAPLLTKGPNAGGKPAGLVRAAENRAAALRELEAQLESAQSAANAQREVLAKLSGEGAAPVAPGKPQPAASAVPPVREAAPPAPLTPRASAVPTDAPPVTPRVTPEAAPVTPASTAADNVAPRNAIVPDNMPPAAPVATREVEPPPPATPPATGATDPVAVGSMPKAAEAATPELPGGRPQLPPSTRGEVNWKTWLDPESPGAKSVEARLQEAAPAETVKAARGYESMNATYARSLAAAKELVDDNGLQTLDAKKVRAFVERHGEAAIPALKRVATENASVMDQAAKAMNNPLASADEVAAATRVYESAMRQTDELLGNIVQEQARTGRSLNALKIQTKLSTDPDTWLIHAKRALGDKPMSDEMMANVRRLAREAADACGGG
jgi:hypothetical protein